MATPTERKALISLGIVAVLCGGVRLWRTSHAANSTGERYSSGDSADRWHGSYERGTYQGEKSHDYKARSSKRRSHASGRSLASPTLDSTSIIDLDRASQADIEALGVLKAGGARLIVANRDSFGPFGSITEVERIPYLTKGEIRKLARRVTFSAPPRPQNLIFPGHLDSLPRRRKRSL